MSLLFNFFQATSSSIGISIILLSISISLLLIPFDYFLEIRRKKIQPKLDKIKPIKEELERAYTGQVKFYYLKTLYRQNNFSLIDQFLPSFSLLIQIPIFILAYNFLKEQSFEDISFFIIKDLSLPDALLTYKGMNLNLLPLAMTFVNLISIEMQVGLDKSSKILLRFIALIFLFLLYSMPSAMVLYWLTSNIFSFLKLIFKFESRKNLTQCIFDFSLTLKEKLFSLQIDPVWHSGTLILCFFSALFYFTSFKKNGGAWKTTIVLFSLTLLLRIALNTKSTRSKKTEKLHFLNSVHLALFFLIPVWFYFIGNPDFFQISYIFEILFKTILPLVMFGFVLNFISYRIISFKFNQLFYASLVSTFLWMPFFNFKLNLVPLHNFPIPIFLGLLFFFLVSLLNKFLQNKLLQLGSFASIALGIISFLNANTNLFSFIEANNLSKRSSPQKFSTHLPDLKNKPDVYFLIYDSYMDSKFFKYLNLDNSKVLSFLTKNNFKIYKNKISLENYSLASIGRLYQSFDPISFKYGNESLRNIIAGKNHLDQYLTHQGYISSTIASNYFAPSNGKYFKDVQISNKVGNVILRGILTGSMNSETVTKQKDSNLNSWKTLKDKYYSSPKSQPRWIYVHNFLPGHTPSKTNCNKSWFNEFKSLIDKANKMIISDVSQIITNNPNAIIVIAGDHGPHLHKCNIFSEKNDQITNLKFIDNFGVHVSIRWPTEDYKKYDNFVYLQGIFHSILSYLTHDQSLLSKQPMGEVCLKNVCASSSTPISDGPDKGQMIYDAI